MQFTIVALEPLTTRQLSEFVCKLIFDIEQVPENVAVIFPVTVTFGVRPSPGNPTRLTPAFRERSSVNVPGLINMSCPLTAAVMAAWMVENVPRAPTVVLGSTTKAVGQVLFSTFIVEEPTL
jgi:hypothetical protein